MRFPCDILVNIDTQKVKFGYLFNSATCSKVKGVLEVTSRELKNFQRGLRIFGEIKTFSSVGVEAFLGG